MKKSPQIEHAPVQATRRMRSVGPKKYVRQIAPTMRRNVNNTLLSAKFRFRIAVGVAGNMGRRHSPKTGSRISLSPEP